MLVGDRLGPVAEFGCEPLDPRRDHVLCDGVDREMFAVEERVMSWAIMLRYLRLVSSSTDCPSRCTCRFSHGVSMITSQVAASWAARTRSASTGPTRSSSRAQRTAVWTQKGRNLAIAPLTCCLLCPEGDLNPHALIRALAPQASASAIPPPGLAGVPKDYPTR